MPPEKLNPVTLAADRARNSFNVLPTLNGFDIATCPSEIQEQRTIFIARKCRLPRHLAEAISLLAFGELAQ
jgi:hypothetical protein